MGVAQYFDAVDVRHFDVGHNHVVQRAVELSFCGFAGIRSLNLMAFAPQRDVQHFADGALIVAN